MIKGLRYMLERLASRPAKKPSFKAHYFVLHSHNLDCMESSFAERDVENNTPSGDHAVGPYSTIYEAKADSWDEHPVSHVVVNAEGDTVFSLKKADPSGNTQYFFKKEDYRTFIVIVPTT